MRGHRGNRPEAERRLVVPAVNCDGASRALNRRGGLGERRHLPAAQQPNQADLVIAGQTAVARVWLRGWRLEPEQVGSRPAKDLGLIAPASEEASAILDGGPPAVDVDEIGATGLKGGQCTTKTIYTTKGCSRSHLRRGSVVNVVY